MPEPDVPDRNQVRDVTTYAEPIEHLLEATPRRLVVPGAISLERRSGPIGPGRRSIARRAVYRWEGLIPLSDGDLQNARKLIGSGWPT
jgi:hypothetical protein